MANCEGPFVVIENVFKQAKPESMVCVVSDAGAMDSLSVINKSLADLVYKKRELLGVADIKPLDLSKEKAEELRQAIKSEKQWLDLYHDALNVSGLKPLGSLEDQLSAINIQWYIETVSNLRTMQEDANGILHIQMDVASSYAIQLNRRGFLKEFQPATIRGIVLSRDSEVVFGVRAGNTYVGAVIDIPAGAITPKDGIFGSNLREVAEEAGIVPCGKVSIAGLIGTFYDYKISGFNFVVLTKTDYSSQDIINLWANRASDKTEHSEFVFKNLSQLPEYLIQNADVNREKSQVNLGSVIPSGMGSSLVFLGHHSPSDMDRVIAAHPEFYAKK